MKIRAFSSILATLAALLALAAPICCDAAIEPLSEFPQALLSIKTRTGNVHQFNVWIANSNSRQEQGLMYVRKLEEHRGMLFVYAHDRHISMWMKNTLIPLDMLFINADGTISHIAARATPQSLQIISAPQPVRAVLELDGGATELLGIQAGDRIFCDALDAPAGARSTK